MATGYTLKRKLSPEDDRVWNAMVRALQRAVREGEHDFACSGAFWDAPDGVCRCWKRSVVGALRQEKESR